MGKNYGKHPIELSVGEDDGKAFACFQVLNLEEIPKARGKPDASAVNSYLNV